MITLAPLLAGLALFGAPEVETVAFPSLSFYLMLSDELENLNASELELDDGGRAVAQNWGARLGEKRIGVHLRFYDADAWSLREPGDVSAVVIYNEERREQRYEVLEETFHEGPYGYAPFASFFVADVGPPESTTATARHFLLCGLLEEVGYVVHVTCEGLPDAAEEKLLRRILMDAVSYDGPVRDADWTTEDILARWQKSVPEELHEDFVKAMRKKSTAKKVCIRTKNYLILTNSSGGKLFSKKLEENYKTIRGVYPFLEVRGRRLMPIFLFKTPAQYYDYYIHNAEVPLATAKKSKGHAWKDYYATWYEAPKDPVHIHEQVHQVFSSRLRLKGGGSWFQEGVAEYVETNSNELNIVARHVKDAEATSLLDLVQLSSLLNATKQGVAGGNRARDHYKQAALLVEFLCESKFGKGKFEAFVRTLGKVDRGDVEAIEAGFRKVYGVGIEGVEEAWRAYCKKR